AVDTPRRCGRSIVPSRQQLRRVFYPLFPSTLVGREKGLGDQKHSRVPISRWDHANGAIQHSLLRLFLCPIWPIAIGHGWSLYRLQSLPRRLAGRWHFRRRATEPRGRIAHASPPLFRGDDYSTASWMLLHARSILVRRSCRGGS